MFWNEARQQVARARPEGKKVTRSVAPVSDRAKETAFGSFAEASARYPQAASSAAFCVDAFAS